MGATGRSVLPTALFVECGPAFMGLADCSRGGHLTQVRLKGVPWEFEIKTEELAE